MGRPKEAQRLGVGGGGGDAPTDGATSPRQQRSVEKAFEEAQLSGALCLRDRGLRFFPRAADKFDLRDTITADLAHNRLTELPLEVCEYGYLETLHLDHNCLRAVPIAAQRLESLTYLDLSRNELCVLPDALCSLPLKVLLLNQNRLESVQACIAKLAGTLTDLDVSDNRLANLPDQIGFLVNLRVLNVKRNLLSDLPSGFCQLRLRILDVSSNRLTRLPVDLRLLSSLTQFCANDNPLTSPPIDVCAKGLSHVFKSLALDAAANSKPYSSAGSSTWWQARCGSLPRLARPGSGGDMAKSTSSDRRPSRRTMARFNTIGGDSGYASTADEANRLSRDLENGAPPELKRSSPIGEETPPPPPPDFALTLSTPSKSAPAKAPPTPTSPGSFVAEVMNACRNLGARAAGAAAPLSVSTTPRDDGGSPTPKVTPNRSSRDADRAAFDYASAKSTTNAPAVAAAALKLPVGGSAPLRTMKSDEIAAIYTGGGSPKKAPPTSVDAASSAESTLTADQLNVSASTCDSIAEEQQTAPPVRNGLAVATNGARKTSASKTANGGPPRRGSLTSSNSRSSISSAASSESTSATKPRATAATAAQRPKTAASAKASTTSNGLAKTRDSLSVVQNSSLKKTAAAGAKAMAPASPTNVNVMRKTLEGRLGVVLPADATELATALSDGVHLCNFVNQLRVRSVASVHMPTDSAPALSAAKCRRNVENFVSACRRIGIPESQLCSQSDVLEKRNLSQLARTVTALGKQLGLPRSNGLKSSSSKISNV